MSHATYPFRHAYFSIEPNGNLGLSLLAEYAVLLTTFPPDGYQQVASALPGIEVYAPVAETTEAEAEVVQFKYPRCQATTAYSAAAVGYGVRTAATMSRRLVLLWGSALRNSSSRWRLCPPPGRPQGGERSAKRCFHQAQFGTSLPPGRLTSTCPFCGSNQVLQQDAPDDHLRPRFLIPFAVDADRCRAIAREWMSSSWMTPKSLKTAAGVTELTEVYVPYWTFDARFGVVASPGWPSGHGPHLRLVEQDVGRRVRAPSGVGSRATWPCL